MYNSPVGVLYKSRQAYTSCLILSVEKLWQKEKLCTVRDSSTKTVTFTLYRRYAYTVNRRTRTHIAYETHECLLEAIF